jgi:hypothetical protein
VVRIVALTDESDRATQADAGKNPAPRETVDGRDRHLEQLGDLSGGHDVFAG